MKASDGIGGLRISPAASKKVVLGGADIREGSSLSSRAVALPRDFEEASCFGRFVEEESLLLAILSVWLRL